MNTRTKSSRPQETAVCATPPDPSYRERAHEVAVPLCRSRVFQQMRGTPEPGKPRVFPPASRKEHAVGETDSAKRNSVPLPSAIDPAYCRARCCASPAEAQCDGHANRHGCKLRHIRGRQERNPDDSEGVPVRPAMEVLHQPGAELVVSHCGWLR